MDASTPTVATTAAHPAAHWLDSVRARVERELARILDPATEPARDARWARGLSAARSYSLRPGKRLRPALLVVGHGLAAGTGTGPPGLWRFAAGVELVHTFMLVHDDVADGAATRRGGASLHRQVGGGRRGEQLAIVLGDHLFAYGIETMLATGLPQAADVVRHYLGVCRETAAGQYLDLDLAGAPLASVTLFEALCVARLKTARYGFAAPLVCGAWLGGGSLALRALLDRLGRQIGVAFQLQDDLLGLFGDGRDGKPVDLDLAARKPTFPVVAAWQRASAATRCELDALWAAPTADRAAVRRLAELVDRTGGRAAAERAIARGLERAADTIHKLPTTGGTRDLLATLVRTLAGRVV